MNKSTRNQMLAVLVITIILAVLPHALNPDHSAGWMVSYTVLGTGAFVLLLLYIDPILEERGRKQWEDDVRYSMKFIAKVQQEISDGTVIPCQHCGSLLPSNSLKCSHCGAPIRQKRLE